MTCPTAFPFLFFLGGGFIVFTLKLHDRACGSFTQNVNCWPVFKNRRNLGVAARGGGGK